MAALEKLVKSLESLKSLISSSAPADESGMRSKEKMSLCVIITDMICTPEAKKVKNFQNLLSYSMETLLKMCNDEDSSIRMIADECLNRIIRVHMDSNIIRINIELYNEIKRNQSARSLRAALWRFAELAHLIRLSKAKTCMQSLVGCIVNIAMRKEETVLETLATSIPKILSSLGCFLTDSDVKLLLETFMKNIHSDNVVMRRTAASSILGICLHCPKRQFFIIHTLSTLLDSVLPLSDDHSTYTILGVLNCIRGLISHLESDGKETSLYGSFGAKRKHNKQVVLSVDSVIQIYELCLYWTHHSDHNVVTSALETLNELLSSPPSQLVKILTDNQGLERSRIHVASNWKLTNRTLSELSVATAPLQEDHLLMENIDFSPTTNLSEWLQDDDTNGLNLPNTPGLGSISPNPTLDLIQDYPDSESVTSEDLGMLLKPHRSRSPEPDMIPLRDSPSPPLEVQNNMDWDIGDAVESNQCPLVYCARRLVTAFLIPECCNARVSVKALALTCLTQVVRLNPHVFLQEVDKNGLSTLQGFSHICDVFCFANHTDPQLRGLVRVLIGTFISSMYNKGLTGAKDWFSKDVTLSETKNLNLEKLIDFFIEGLSDESSVCVRHTLTGLGLCLINLMENMDFTVCTPVLEKLLDLAYNPYWLVKVKLIELLCMLPYQCIYYITGNNKYQTRVLDSVLELLANEDDRVRKTTAEGVINLVKNLYFPLDYGQNNVIVARGAMLSLSTFANVYNMEKGETAKLKKLMTENVLSRMVQMLIQHLLASPLKYFSYGCIETLAMLSQVFSPTEYPRGWQLLTNLGEQKDISSTILTSSNLFLFGVTLLTSSSISLDLESHQWLLKLVSNLFTGLASNGLSKNDKKLVAGVDSLLTHVMRVLAIFVQVMEENTQSRSSGTSPLRRRTSRAASPTKISTTDKEGKEEKKLVVGHYGSNPHYMKLYDIVRAGYTNYKLTLEFAASEKFLNLICYTLKCMEKLAENPFLIELSSVMEELLQYLRVTFVLDSAATVKVVTQLIKSWRPTQEPQKVLKEENTYASFSGGFYTYILQKPVQELSFYLSKNYELQENPNWKKQESEKSLDEPQYNVEELKRKINLFTAIVIQSLTEYMVTNNVKLQVEVLTLLIELVKLKVNYCLLDAGLVFLNFVKGQLEYLEAGQICQAELLVPQIFTFLVNLLNKQNQAKTNIGVPQIIQMCDGLMASGQNPVTHSIPALGPVIHHVFMFNTTDMNDEKELETQREVVLAMLIRLAEYPQVLDMIYKLMKEGWKFEEHWKRWYRQVVDTIRPLLAEGRLLITDCSTLHALLSLNKSFSAPLNNILALLFTHQQEGQTLEQWLGMLTTMLFSICTYKEERVLLQLEEMNLYVREEGDDPLKVNTISKTIAPQHLLAKLLTRVIHTCALKIENIISGKIDGNIVDLEKIFSNFFLCCVLLLQPGNYKEVSKSLLTLLNSNTELQEMHKMFVGMACKCPMITLLWAEILVLLGIGNIELWSELIVKKRGSHSLNYHVVKEGSVILYCKYLASRPDDTKSLRWLLDNHIEDVVSNCEEQPIVEMLNSIYNIEENSKILLDALSTCTLDVQPVFSHRLLQTLKNVHSKYTGSVLCLVASFLTENKNIAIARLSAAFCSRTIEYMLTLDNSSVEELLEKDKLITLLKKLSSCPKQYKRHNALISLLKKLGEQVYGITTLDFETKPTINMENISSVKLDKSWLLNQIISKCSKTVDSDRRKCARLLSMLGVEELKVVMSSSSFDTNILQYCFIIGTQLSLKQSIKDANCVLPECVVPLYDCARTLLLALIAKICRALPSTDEEMKPNKGKLNNILCKTNLKTDVMPVVKGLINYLQSFKDLLKAKDNILKIIPEKQPQNLMRFGMFCLQVIHWKIKTNVKRYDEWPWMLENLLECASAVFSIDILSSHLTINSISCVSACLFDLHKSVCGKDIPFKDLRSDCDMEETKDNDEIINSSLRVASLVSSIDVLTCCPNNIYKCLRSIIISLGRQQKINWFCRIPVEAWQFPIDGDIPPPIPMHLLHDSEILSQIVNRMCLLGWTGRHQFEEMWVCLLSALSPNPDLDNTDQEEISSIMQANSLAIDGITWLVLSTLSSVGSNSSDNRLLHVPRLPNDKLYKLRYWKRLEEMNEILCWKMKSLANEDKPQLMRVDKRPNLERIQDFTRYGFGQVSISYLQAQIAETDTQGTDDRMLASLSRSGNYIDIRSCVQFVLDLYGQWVLPNSGISLNLQLSMIKSVLCLSDMFTERNHFTWMFNTFMNLLKTHPHHDEILHQYIIIGICKAAAVLNICEDERSEKILKILDSSLKSSFVPMKIAGLNSLLYLLQNVQNIKKPEPNAEVPKLSPSDFRNKIIDMAIDYVYKHSHANGEEITDEDSLLLLALVVYLLEVFPEESIDNISAPTMLKTVIPFIQSPKNNLVYLASIQGLERLVLVGNAGFNEQITRLALDRFSDSDPRISLPALQLLIASMYADKTDSDRGDTEQNHAGNWPMELMEKTAALFDKIKRGYPVEVEIVCEILPGILSDFCQASDVLTTVIGTFLKPNQPHKKNMAAVVFQVFTQACSEKQLPLLQEWVVHSLNNFIHNLPAVTAVWSLCCFFISASSNPWLRAIFPHVQSRIRQYDYEDRQILCIAAIDFYNQLNPQQQEIFRSSFKDASSSQKTIFSDIISCL
ncbi:huntingtin [Cimex lectularius]|uniref:Huntingtin n=1 Tax=Cimex lectularius TaxID=79782 RepID=A0A8I6SGC4_CIMLE|nr:huntingtin [Cimex lectularius]XP_024081476.1 huntingtin [Cimex lectularius]